jgi:hypothetical protein
VANQRTSLKERRAGDAKGVEVLFDAPPERSAAEKEAAPEKPPLAKVTLYVRPDQVLAVEKIQLAERERTGKRRDKSELVQEALDLLIEKYGLE